MSASGFNQIEGLKALNEEMLRAREEDAATLEHIVKENIEVARKHLEENIRLSARLEEALDAKAAQSAHLKELRRREKTVWLVLLKAAKKYRRTILDHPAGVEAFDPVGVAIDHVDRSLVESVSVVRLYDEGGRR